jgi:hypothetical protein
MKERLPVYWALRALRLSVGSLLNPLSQHELRARRRAFLTTGRSGFFLRQRLLPTPGNSQRKRARGRKGKGRTSDILAAWVARSGLSKERAIILGEAKTDNREFFMSLGRYLSGDLMVELWDHLDEAIARNWQKLTRMKRREATQWLRKNGFSDLTEERFRKRLVRLKLTNRRKKSL